MYFLSSLKNDRLSEVLENFTVEESNEEQIKEVVKIAKCCLEVKGEERPTMKEVAVQLDGLRKKEKHPWVNVDLSHVEEAESLLDEISVAQKDEVSRSTVETAGYDGTRNPLVPFELGDGR
ncbi:Wall-associated receptor kinase 4 [Morella rubra]|uniref:Wall-associated receptor kinase 4 n=1 Tax=Morella rubra TaxID=262757 RepID=A0A6A1VI78_9ROSI|nr:Wall-associated receptor kinase 4 [Morella rubra]